MGIKHRTILRCGPVVCAVGHSYQIMVPVNCETLMHVTIGEENYYCHSNGVRRTDCPVQCFSVPMEKLDRAGEYTIHYRKVISRQAYSCIKGKLVSRTYSFRPLTKTEDINIYVLSDCHGLFEEAVRAGSYFGDDLDLLILNGDISSSCMTVDEAMLPFDIAYAVTKGNIPCVITRGNHDLRGKYSERLHELMPTDHGNTYYQVILGSLWLLVLDCGEDKDDAHREYGGTAAFHAMRVEESDFIRQLASASDAVFRDADVKHKLVISHIPVSYRDRGTDRNNEHPFDIEDDLYAQWVDTINKGIEPELYIAGHLHTSALWPVESDKNARKLCCPVLISGKPIHGKNRNCFGAAITCFDDHLEICFSDQHKTITGRETVLIKGRKTI